MHRAGGQVVERLHSKLGSQGTPADGKGIIREGKEEGGGSLHFTEKLFWEIGGKKKSRNEGGSELTGNITHHLAFSQNTAAETEKTAIAFRSVLDGGLRFL